MTYCNFLWWCFIQCINSPPPPLHRKAFHNRYFPGTINGFYGISTHQVLAKLVTKCSPNDVKWLVLSPPQTWQDSTRPCNQKWHWGFTCWSKLLPNWEINLVKIFFIIFVCVCVCLCICVSAGKEKQMGVKSKPWKVQRVIFHSQTSDKGGCMIEQGEGVTSMFYAWET